MDEAEVLRSVGVVALMRDPEMYFEFGLATAHI
jgi:hypothetical protein